MRSILVTGCNRGLGLGLVKHLVKLSTPPENIFATCRDTNKATELKELAERSGNIHIIEIDLTNVDNYEKIVTTVKEKVGSAGLNVLFNNAGISQKFSRLGMVKQQDLTNSFLINTVAPIMLAKKLLPLLQVASKNNGSSKNMSINKAAIINMTSILGSITQNDQGGFYSYRCSKAALNAATKSMSIDLKDKGILVVCLHPGWVRTDMGGNNAPMDIDSSISSILNVMKTLSEKHTGMCLQYDGTTLPW